MIMKSINQETSIGYDWSGVQNRCLEGKLFLSLQARPWNLWEIVLRGQAVASGQQRYKTANIGRTGQG